MSSHRQQKCFDEVPVNTEPDAHFLVLWFEVDVAGAIAHCLADNAVHQLNDGCLIVELYLGSNGGDLRLIVAEFERFDEAVDVFVGAIHLIDECPHGEWIGNEKLHRPASCRLDCCPPCWCRIAAQNDECRAFRCNGDCAVLANDSLVENALDVVGDFDALGVDRGDVGRL